MFFVIRLRLSKIFMKKNQVSYPAICIQAIFRRSLPKNQACRLRKSSIIMRIFSLAWPKMSWKAPFLGLPGMGQAMEETGLSGEGNFCGWTGRALSERVILGLFFFREEKRLFAK